MSQEKIMDNIVGKVSKTALTRRTVLSGAAAVGLSTMARAQVPAEVKVGLSTSTRKAASNRSAAPR
jgi:hypothetical protein